MDQRAQSYITVARRIAMCPLSIDAREMLLASAGASKFTYGIELGSCQIKLEKQLRTAVSKALWSKGQQKSVDMLLTLCHRGHRIDPSQLKLFYPLKLTRRQLLKHVDLRNQYVHCWHVSAAHRSNFKDGRSNMVGPICNLQTICVALGWQWNSPFEFSFPLDDHHTLEFSILNIPEDYFLHLVRFSINKLLWTRASNARKALRGIQIGIDKATTIQLLRSSVISQYDKGIMRAILTDAITTQHHLYCMKQVEHPICQFCWNETESLEHLFWKCPRWKDIRKQYLDDSQLHQCLELPLCTQLTGCFLITPPQVQRMFVNHHRILNNSEPFSSLPHSCVFAQQMQRCMIAIIKARNDSTTTSPPNGFDPSPYIRIQLPPGNMPQQDQQTTDLPANNNPSSDSTNNPNCKPTHSPEGYLLSTSTRPGTSKFQHVQYVPKTKKFRAVIPYNGRRHSFGPYQTEHEAAARIKQFFEEIEQGKSLPTRGEKRTSMFHHQLEQQLHDLNQNAQSEKRHFVENTQQPTCRFCQKTVHTYHAVKFAQKLCPNLTSQVDKKGSATRAQKLSQTRTAALQQFIDQHNLTAVSKKQHFIQSIQPPKCKYCNQQVARSYLKQLMIKQCPEVPDLFAYETVANPPPSRRLRGKQSVQHIGA